MVWQKVWMYDFIPTPVSATWSEKRSDHDLSTFFIRAQVFFVERPVIGVWIKQVDDSSQKVEKRACYRQAILTTPDLEEAKERVLASLYMESNVFGMIEPSLLMEDLEKNLQESNAQAKMTFLSMIPDMSTLGVRSLELSLNMLFNYPGWSKVEWGTPGIKPGLMTDW